VYNNGDDKKCSTEAKSYHEGMIFLSLDTFSEVAQQ